MENETAEVAAEVQQKKQRKKKGKTAELYKLLEKSLPAKVSMTLR
ncbi:MAG: hypothetical protein ABSC91_11085 [Candidatus Bathyarchaeia archaeon]